MNFDRTILEICAGKPNVLEKLTREEIFQILKHARDMRCEELLNKLLEMIPPARLTINQWLEFKLRKCIYKKIIAKTYTSKIKASDMLKLLDNIYIFFISLTQGNLTPEYFLIEERYTALLYRYYYHSPNWKKYYPYYNDPQINNILHEQLVSKTLTYEQLTDEQFYKLPKSGLETIIQFMPDDTNPILRTYPDFIKEFNRIIYIIQTLNRPLFTTRLIQIIQMLETNNIPHTIKNKIEILNKLYAINCLTLTNFLNILHFDNLRNIESFQIEIYEPVYKLLTRKDKRLKKALDSTHLTIKKV